MNSPTDMPSENPKDLFIRIGHLTRLLRNSMANLGLEQTIFEVADAFPNTRDRLRYVVSKTSQAADRALTSVEAARPLQLALSDDASALSDRWDRWFADPQPLDQARELVHDTRAYLQRVPDLTQQTNDELTEIMMAQDFQDLTGQVLNSLMQVIDTVERELISVLVENMGDRDAPEDPSEVQLKNGPQVDPHAQGIAASQEQVDDLLDSLGF
ncbi:protein phosphatase CheZ [Pantoea sp. JGM49]|jgi:chemotaxis protein CheZ|uniref:protein phosphatase CheZ n=1 Tax=Enterobacterales TaxID=91347 RepID=UPI0005380C37|nr:MULTISPECIES: protein phosphatase CheZ [Enterobacterales]KGT89721.1 chemotaxis protein CheZ [Enterobacter cancerogenus]MBS0882948.1 protein phosphatase CheZ [Pantoea sp. JGM49]MDI9279049.1 protein phosphatase CheZ [Pantoea sp. EABMAA-21]MXP54478.1 protein phosphatase CheZ [Pantoea sp. Seng]SNY67447.1 chemotaxis protein CheZ [Pantoea sp. GL120224-02]